MTIEEGNIIIAEFLGGEVKKAWSVGNSITYAWYGNEIVREHRKLHGLGDLGDFKNQCLLIKDLKFHSDWNCLMSVVEKIESIYDEFHGYFGVSIYSNNCCIQGTRLRTNPENFHPAYFTESTLSTKIQSVWEQVVYFIMWWNENLKK